jgi:protease-4
MAYDLKPDPASGPRSEQRIVIQQLPPKGSLLGRRFLMLILGVSILANFWMLGKYNEYFIQTAELPEKFHSGETFADKKIAVIRAHGLIAEEASDYVVKQAKQAKEDDDVVAVVVEIDSPGGLVSDSHRIYHRLSELSSEKPVIISMKGLAASGGYYIAMAAGKNGKIFAEPTTWTGSIGVIMPHFDVVGLMDKLGVRTDPIKTGPLKDSGSPFHVMTDEERDSWTHIINQSFETFLNVIDEGRPNLSLDQVRELATGEVYTAEDAMQKGLIDAIGYLEEAIDEAKNRAGLQQVRVVTYSKTPTVLELLTGASSQAAAMPKIDANLLLELTVPRALYLFTATGSLTVGGAR